MKVIFKTRNSMGNRNLVKRGVQLDCQVIEYGYDSPDDFKAINLILDVMRSECKDCGIYLKFLPRRRIEAEGVIIPPPQGKCRGGGFTSEMQHGITTRGELQADV